MKGNARPLTVSKRDRHSRFPLVILATLGCFHASIGFSPYSINDLRRQKQPVLFPERVAANNLVRSEAKPSASKHL